MITDHIRNAALYFGMNTGLEKALRYLQKTDFTNMEPGRYEIDGDDVFALVQQYNSKPLAEGKWEAHRKYTDVQYVVAGTERMGYGQTGDFKTVKAYDPESDCLFLEGSGNMLLAKAGTFAVFGPEDVHMPTIAENTPQPVKKVVVKVRVGG